MMTTVELQNSIIRNILQTSDNQLLDYLNTMLSETVKNSSGFYELDDFEKTIINESLQEYKLGKTLSNEEVFTKTKKWLEE